MAVFGNNADAVRAWTIIGCVALVVSLLAAFAIVMSTLSTKTEVSSIPDYDFEPAPPVVSRLVSADEWLAQAGGRYAE